MQRDQEIQFINIAEKKKYYWGVLTVKAKKATISVKTPHPRAPMNSLTELAQWVVLIWWKTSKSEKPIELVPVQKHQTTKTTGVLSSTAKLCNIHVAALDISLITVNFYTEPTLKSVSIVFELNEEAQQYTLSYHRKKVLYNTLNILELCSDFFFSSC